MGINIGDNIRYQGQKFLDDRESFATLAEIVDYSETNVPDGFITYCAENGKRYEFKSSNTVDVTTGKWREYVVQGGGEGSGVGVKEVLLFDGSVPDVSVVQDASVPVGQEYTVRFLSNASYLGNTGKKMFAALSGDRYYSGWDGGEEYMNGATPYTDKVYVDRSEVVRMLYMWDGSGLVPVSGGGDVSGSMGSQITLYVENPNQTIPYGDGVGMTVDFSSTDKNGIDTGNGIVKFYVNSLLVFTRSIAQGRTDFDLTRHTKLGNNEVKIEVTDSYGATASRLAYVELIQLSIDSYFSVDMPFTSGINFTYLPSGGGVKVVHFVLDGDEIGTQTINDNTGAQRSFPISLQSHGAHLLEVYMVADINGVTVESNRLRRSLMFLEDGRTDIIISTAFVDGATWDQYSTISIPYIIYNPEHSTQSGVLEVNGVPFSTISVNRTPQTWTYRLDSADSYVFSIVAGDARRDIGVNVRASGVVIEAVTEDLELHLNAVGRSNDETSKMHWNFTQAGGTTISTELTGFNWATDGWMQDKSGSSVLRFLGKARANIPLAVFPTGVEAVNNTGKTIELEFAISQVSDYQAELIRCFSEGIGFVVTPQKMTLNGGGITKDAYYKENERIRVSIVIEKKAQNRLVYVFINGVLSAVEQYLSTGSFSQISADTIHLGSDKATLDVYSVRVYKNNLSKRQILYNHIADMDDVGRKTDVYVRNQVYNANGQLDYNKLIDALPIMTIIGTLPYKKGMKPKLKVSVNYEDRQNPANSFYSEGVEIDVQGTSSQFYPRKNYKTKHKGGFVMSATGELEYKYKLRESSLEVNTFCLKTDFAESSGTHNTGMAKLINDMLVDRGILTPPQAEDGRVRTTVDGFPILVFHKETSESDATFLGKYNFNNDKSTQETFGFSGTAECWEFKNNIGNRVLFEAVNGYAPGESFRHDTKVVEGKDYYLWNDDFEARYPDDDDLNDRYANGEEFPESWMRFLDWVYSCKGDPAKFKSEAKDHLDVETFKAYVLITELFGMVDQRAKNMFFARWPREDGKEIWYTIFYDNDTCFGIGNTGLIEFDYSMEYHDRTTGGETVWNGESSVLWGLFEEAYSGEIKSFYQQIRDNRVLTYDIVVDYLNTTQSDMWCEAVYNEDAQFKYIDPAITGYDPGDGTGWTIDKDYLPVAQGSRAEHRKWWVYNRFKYMDSKYFAGDFSAVSNGVMIRVNSPTGQVVEPNQDVEVTPIVHGYVQAMFGQARTDAVRCKAGETATLHGTIEGVATDLDSYIYGADRIRSLGDLSALYMSEGRFGNAVNLEELIVGNHTEGYKGLLKSLGLGNNVMLRKLDITNCPVMKEALNVSQCVNIKEIWAKGSSIPTVQLPDGGNLEQLHLPATIQDLRLVNQNQLNADNFSMEGYEAISTLVIENTSIDAFDILDKIFDPDSEEDNLRRVRVVNITGVVNDLTNLVRLTDKNEDGSYKIGGIGDNGELMAQPFVTGNLHVELLYAQQYEKLREAFPELTITYSKNVVYFEDPEFKRLLVSSSYAWDKNGDGEIGIDEIEGINGFGYTFSDNEVLRSVMEMRDLYNMRPTYQQPFKGCPSLARAATNARSFEQNVWGMFDTCSALEHVELAEGPTTMKSCTFRGCTSLKGVKLPESLTELTGATFERSGIEEIVLPEGILTLGDTNFYNCPNLVKATVGGNVVSMGKNTFDATVPVVIMKAVTPPAITSNTFGSASGTGLIYVPDEAYEDYLVATNWASYAARIRKMSLLPVA